jgi:hypothetical protein
MSIPASKLVSILPGVLAAGGAAVTLSGLVLTADTSVPIGTVSQFSTADNVGKFFGSSSPEKGIADIYFAGYDNSTAKPGNLLFSQYPTASVAAYLRGGAVTDLDAVKAITPGTMTVTVDGVLKTSSTITLSSATSLSNAATIITAAFSTGPVVTYDATKQAFVATSGTTGASSTITFAAGAVATALRLTQATGAVISQGSVAYTPAAAMTAITNVALNWATFMTMFEPVLADKLAFGAWAGQQNDKFAYAAWDTDVNAVVANDATAFGPQAKLLGLPAVAVTVDPARAAALGVTAASLARPLAAMVMGYAASLDFSRTNGRTTLAFRTLSGIVSTVTDATVADILKANGYNFYGEYATSAGAFNSFQNGQISNRFKWADSFYNQVRFNSEVQSALIELARSTRTPYNPDGYTATELSMSAGPVENALNYGTITPNTVLAGNQISIINAATGNNAASVVASRGWYIQVKDPGPVARAERLSPEITMWYSDGGSVQQFTAASIMVQ